MDTFLLAISLPQSIRNRLSTLCCGLQQVRWIDEENFHITLRYFGPLSNQQLSEIQARLQNLFFHPFNIQLDGLYHHRSQVNRGVIGIKIAGNDEFNLLKKEIETALRGLKLPADNGGAHPHVTLGHHDRINVQKLADYLTAYEAFQSLPFEISCCNLLRIQPTPKRVFYHVVEEYHASPPETGED